MTTKYTKRYVANIVIEAATPLKVGSSDVDMLQDSPVQKDWNELPMILGTSIAGVLRKEFDTAFANDVFGDEDAKKKANKGSRIIISNALLCDENMQVQEKLLTEKTPFLKLFENLPLREHTAITEKGVAKENSKFDEEVVYKGSRFKFRLEFIADENDRENWKQLLETLNSKIFRLGSGTTKGFGDMRVLRELSSYDVFDLDSDEYRSHSSSLNTSYNKAFDFAAREVQKHENYLLEIAPDDFFIFGSGFGDDDADATPVFESVIDYETKELSKQKILIPASSIKGALAHRALFHYNKIMGNTIEKENGAAVLHQVFGAAKDEENESKGKLLMSDCFMSDKADRKIFDHVGIDRFTGGAMDGVLFQEKTLHDERAYKIEILLEKDVEKEALKAFELALQDITTGMLPLGGMTTKGHGFFSGTLFKNGVKYEVTN